MSAPKKLSKRKPVTSARTTDQVASNDSKAEGFNKLVTSIAKAHGVLVASAPEPVKNPYAVSADKVAEIARRAGIITKSGKLSRVFK